MQIIDRNGQVTVKLTQAEGRRLRDAAYIAQRAAINESDAEKSEKLKSAAATVLAFANDHTPEASQAKLDKQDKEELMDAIEAGGADQFV